MDTPSNPPGAMPAPGAASSGTPRLQDVERALRDHRYLLHVVMGVVVVLLITSSLGLFHQIRWLMSQASQFNATAQELTKAVGDYETNTQPQMKRLFDELGRFAQTNPEFAKIMARYRVVGDASPTNTPPLRPTSPEGFR